MAPKFIFYDYHKDKLIEMMTILNKIPNSKFIVTDVEKMLNNNLNIDIIISPANSFANMGGGIDLILKQIFPNVDKKVHAQINKLQLAKTSTGNSYLPIGQCIIVPTGDKRCPNLISAPTMFLPKNIKGTDNVYLAFLAILNKIGNTNFTIACCGMGTGIGGLSGT
jgi:O-acetyl-ADP-ribose deacetylase (regulator of RNase III)